MRVFPIILIAVGTFLLLRNLGLISTEVLSIWWPLILIVVGAAALFRFPRR